MVAGREDALGEVATEVIEANDTSNFIGGPIPRHGGKGLLAPKLIPHFARAKSYVEPFFGAGSIFYRLKPGLYQREAVNDLDKALITFFRVLRERPDELVNACEITPYARDEFLLALERSEDPLEEARRVWVRYRQGFAGMDSSWGRNTGDCSFWAPSAASSKLASLRVYAARLRDVAIDNIDAIEFIEKWGSENVAIYCDPPYVAESRKGECYEHEMDTDHHRRLAVALHAAVAKGAKCCVSGYPSELYSKELFPAWRTVEFDVALNGTRDATGMRRTEVLWCSYPAEDSFVGMKQKSLF